MKKIRINWSKMHRKNYDGTCEYCGGLCNDEESIMNWALALSELDSAHYNVDLERAQYLGKKIDSKRTWARS